MFSVLGFLNTLLTGLHDHHADAITLVLSTLREKVGNFLSLCQLTILNRKRNYSVVMYLLIFFIILIYKLKGSVKERNMFHNYETEKITRKASDVAENLQLYRVVRFFHPRSSCRTHLMLFSERPPIYASCMMISGVRTEQHVITGFGELAAVDYNT